MNELFIGFLHCSFIYWLAHIGVFHCSYVFGLMSMNFDLIPDRKKSSAKHKNVQSRKRLIDVETLLKRLSEFLPHNETPRFAYWWIVSMIQWQSILLMEEIRRSSRYGKYAIIYIHVRWVFGISSINSIIKNVSRRHAHGCCLLLRIGPGQFLAEK